MKSAILSIAAVLISMVAASPGEGYHIARADDVADEDIVEMTWMGPVRVGGENVTLTGTAQSVYAQILKMNPEYSAWDFPEYKARMNAQGITKENRGRLLQSRSETGLAKRAGVDCDVEGKEVGNYLMQCMEGYDYLMDLGGNCDSPKHKCTRVSCSDNCGIFLCNKNDRRIWVPCSNIAGDFRDIAMECAYEYTDGVASLKGRCWRNGPPKWSTIVKGQSC